MRKNPFTMLGKLDDCLLFMYRTPVESIRPFVPDCFELMTYKGHAIIGVVVSKLAEMRPWPLPKWVGVGYNHIAYRVYVQFTPPSGKPIQGLYFLRSDANSPLMTMVGNLLTDFRYHNAHIKMGRTEESFHLEITQSSDGLGEAQVDLDFVIAKQLTPHSCFTSIDEAMEVLHYEPYGLFYDPKRGAVNVVKVTREESLWRERPLHINHAKWSYLEHLLGDAFTYELAIVVDSIPYRWERGVEYSLK